MNIHWIVLFATLLACVVPTYAEYGFQRWTVDSGLPESEVRGVTQTKDGYLWIATMNGLVRFDGLNFSIFNKGNSPGILSNRFIVLGQSTDGDLWAVYERNGILRYHKGRFRTCDIKDGIPGNDVSTVTTDSMGNVWILSNGKVAQWQPQLDRFRLSTELNKRVYGPLVWENKGFVAYDSNNLYCFSRGRSQIYRLPERLTGKRILRVGLGQDWVAWLTMSDGAVIRLAPRDATDGHELPKERDETYLSPNGGSWIFHNLLRVHEIVQRSI